MANLGDFGQQRDGIDISFTYFGDEIRVNPDLSELDVLDFMEQASSMDDEDPRSVHILKGFFRSLLHPDDFETFWGSARRNRQRVDDIQNVAKAVIEAISARPTSQPSDSSPGRRHTARKSRAVSSGKVLNRLAGRPDLQLAVVKRQEARHAV